MKITRRDPMTGKVNTIDLPVTLTQIKTWQRGALAQVAFANLNADQREFILTGIMPESWPK